MSTVKDTPAVWHPGPMSFPYPELLEPAAYAHAVRDLRLIETGISWVLLTGDFAYKIKKPLHFDFLDASTLERRSVLCEEEVRLNLRFAPDLYLRVARLTRDPTGLRMDGSGPTVEYAVCMFEFAAADGLDQRLAGDVVNARSLEDFGARLADAHDRSAVAGSDLPYGGFEEVRQQVYGNLSTLLASLPGEEDLKWLALLISWTHRAAARLEPLIVLRKDSGAVRECHGDLHVRNILYWHGELTAFDCLEFSPQLRWIDVVSDVAFLFMDLIAYGRTDLAFAFLNGYLAESGDYDGLRLLPFYAVYRALVRAKVDALAAETSTAEEAAELHRRLTRRLETAATLTAPRQPAITLMHGLTASGKSRVSAKLALKLGAVRIRSDLERKRLTGAAALSHRTFAVGSGDYDEAATNRTCARLVECAQSALQAGYPVIVDATFLDRKRRDIFRRIAIERRCPCVIVACRAPPELLRTRIVERAAAADDPSEATIAVLAHQIRNQDPLTAHELTHTVDVWTDSPQSVAAGLAAVQARLADAVPRHTAAGV